MSVPLTNDSIPGLLKSIFSDLEAVGNILTFPHPFSVVGPQPGLVRRVLCNGEHAGEILEHEVLI